MTKEVSPHGRLFSARAAARYLGVSLYRVRALVASGALVAVRNPDNTLGGIYEHDCDAWLATARRVGSAPQPAAVDVHVATVPGVGRYA